MANDILIIPASASIEFSGSAANTIKLQVEDSGSVSFYGNSGSLFGISDNLSGSLMSVNDVSGLPTLETFSDGKLVVSPYAFQVRSMGFGTDTPIGNFDFVNPLAENVDFYIRTTQGSSYDTALHIRGSRTTSTTDELANIRFETADTDAGGVEMARISAIKDVTSTNIARLEFKTTTTDGGSPTTKMMISSSGNVGIGNTTPTHTLSVTGDISASGDVTASAFSGDGSQLTNVAHPDITPGSNISQNNSNGTVIQDLTITLDGDGHVTTATAGTVNLDDRYYTETEVDTTFATKSGVSGSFSTPAAVSGSFNNYTHPNHSGHVTSVNDGATTLTVAGITGQTEMTGDVADTDELLISDAGVIKRLDFSVLRDAIFADVSSDGSIAAGGALTVNNDSHTHNANNLTGTTLNSGVVNSSLTSVGTISTGTWNGTTITVANGGTGATTLASNGVLTGNGTSAIVSEGNLTFDGSKLTVTGEVSASGDGVFDGLVGIGLPSPIVPLHISRAAGSSTFTRFTREDLTNESWDMRISSAGVLEIRSVEDAGTSVLTPFRIEHATGEIWMTTGNVGIGTTSPTADLHISGSTADNDIFYVQGGTTDIIFASGSGNVGIGTITPDQALHVVGEIVATGEITAFYSSDERLKENIQILSTPLTKLTSLRGVEFDWTDEHIDSRGGLDKLYVQKHDVGVIAQEVEKVLPEVVVDRDDGYKAVRYEKMIPLLIEAIKELKTELDEVKQNCRCNSQLEE